MRIRTTGFKLVKASEIRGAPWNWRTHPPDQRQAVAASLDELGFFDPLDVREVEGGYELIDGHLRSEIINGIGPETMVPVNITDFTEAEAKKANLLKDPLASMAEVLPASLDSLMREVDVSDGAIAKMLAELSESAPMEADEERGGKDKEGQYPISPVFNEKYEYAVIFATNETDWAWLQTVLQLKQEKSYKSTGIGIGHVIPLAAFRKLWESKS